MKLDLPSLKQAAERAEDDSSDGYDIDPSIVLELIRQHGVMRVALEIGIQLMCGSPGIRPMTDGLLLEKFRKALEECE